ncbi:MAG: TVP38/TMEM64 family protein [Myxococcota bacterium]
MKKLNSTVFRILGLLVLIGALYGVAHAMGLTQNFTVDGARHHMEQAGAWGVLVFVGLFIVGDLLHVPGLIFVAGAILAYGTLEGLALGYVGALTGQSFNFWLIRRVGGRPLADIERPLVKKVMSNLSEHPIRTVIFLRLVFVVTPAVNYGLAMSQLRYRDYLLASAIGLIPPMSLFAWGLGWFI